MPEVKIYRIEHPSSGRGFLRHPDESFRSKKRVNQIWHLMGNFPPPRKEDIEIESNEYCAFNSISIMLNTLGVNNIKYLITRHGFKVYELVVETKKVGEKQTVFLRSQVKSKINITKNFRKNE